MCRDATAHGNSPQVRASSVEEPETEYQRGQTTDAEKVLKEATLEPMPACQIDDPLQKNVACRYDRDLLLAIGHCIGTSKGDGCNCPVLAKTAALKTDPRLDDEALIAALECRLSRESGADAWNSETFGEECIAGWSFAQALEANACLASRGKLRADAPCFEMSRGLRAEAPSFQPAALVPPTANLNGSCLSTTAAPMLAAVPDSAANLNESCLSITAAPMLAAVPDSAVSLNESCLSSTAAPMLAADPDSAVANFSTPITSGGLQHDSLIQGPPSNGLRGGLRAEAACFKPGAAHDFEGHSTDEGTCSRSVSSGASEGGEAEDVPVAAVWGFLSTVPAHPNRPQCNNIISQLGLA
jgi:hypothetical protein